MMSSRFDPYSSPGAWMSRGADPYGDAYSSHAAPSASSRMTPLGMSRGGGIGATSEEDTSFARDLLRLYTENPTAFDAYARDPVVRRSLKLDPIDDGTEADMDPMAAGGYDQNGQDYYQDTAPISAR